MLTKKRVANKRHLSKNKRALFCNKARFCLIIMTQSDRPHESFCGLFELEGVEDISSCLSQEARESVAAIITRMFLQYFIVFISLFDKSFWLRAQRN